jgi:hypothetical protein
VRAAPVSLLPLGCLLAAACHGGPVASPWIELFDGATLGGFVATQFGGEGEVTVRDGAIELGIGSPLTGVTWTGALPGGDYELEVVAARQTGSDFFCGLTFPVGEHHLTLVLGGWGGTVCGLSSLDGLDAAHNPTRTLRRFDSGRDYTARIGVRAESVVVHLDGQPFLSADLRGHGLSLRPEVELSRPLGCASFATAAAVRAVRWRPLPARAPG